MPIQLSSIYVTQKLCLRACDKLNQIIILFSIRAKANFIPFHYVRFWFMYNFFSILLLYCTQIPSIGMLAYTQLKFEIGLSMRRLQSSFVLFFLSFILCFFHSIFLSRFYSLQFTSFDCVFYDFLLLYIFFRCHSFVFEFLFFCTMHHAQFTKQTLN